MDCTKINTSVSNPTQSVLLSLRKGYQGAGRMLFSIGSKGKNKKGAGRLNLIREQGAGKLQNLEGSKKKYIKGQK